MELRDGERLVLLRAVDGHCFINIDPMLSDLRPVTMRAGEILIVGPVFHADSPTVSVRPHRYESLEAEFVDSETRERDGYGGYHLVFERAVLLEACRPFNGRGAQIPEDRELTADEQGLVKWLLDHGVPSAGAYLTQLPRVRVVSRCDCGCASLNLEVDGRGWRSRGGMEILSDHGWRDEMGHRFGIFLFAKEQALAGIDVFSVDGLAVPRTLPLPGKIDHDS
jgi:hypothetical protein